MRLGLFVGQLGLRGTDQFVFQLADICENDLSHTVVVITPDQQVFSNDVTVESRLKFCHRFLTVFKKSHETLDDIAAQHHLDVVFVAKWGVPDELVTTSVPCIVHAIFDCATPHGDVYVAISECMKEKCKSECDVLPFCVEVLPQTASLRQELGIPDSAIVFGRHGGYDQFDIPFVQRAVERFTRHKKFYFIFMNTKQFMPSSAHVFFLPGSTDLQSRSNFIHACDAMIHGRSDGETFSMACGEFSIANKPIITTPCGDQAHIRILQPSVFVATDTEQYCSCMQQVADLLHTGRPGKFDMYKGFDRQATAKKFSELLDEALHRRAQAS